MPSDIHTINLIEPEVHAKKRKTLNLAFTKQSLKAAAPIMAAHIDRWVDLLCDGTDGVWSFHHDMVTWVDHLVFDVLGDMCFGEAFNTKEPGENTLKRIPHLLMKQVKLGYMSTKSGLLNRFLSLQPCGLSKLLEYISHKKVKAYNTLVEIRVDRRITAHKAGTKAS